MEYIEEKVLGLTLHLPTPWQQEDTNPQFFDNQDHNIYRNPGRSANKLHKQFTDKMGEDTLKQIQSAVYLGAQYRTHEGFKQRNTAVALESEYLVAFTWNNGKTPKEESGTYDTWKKHRGTKLHVPISSLPCVGGRKSLSSFFASRKEPTASTAGDLESGDSIDSGCCCSSPSQSQSSGSEEQEGRPKIAVGLKRLSGSGVSTTIKKPRL